MLARLLLLLVLALAPLATWAQNSTWVLTNISNQTLRFETLHPASQAWQPQVIEPNRRTNYTFSSGYSEGKFRIATPGRGFVEYKVRGGYQYTVGWDQGKGVWDLKFAPGTATPNSGSTLANAPPGPLPAYRLRNTTNQTLNFETYDPARGSWKAQLAYPNQTTSYAFTSGVTRGKIRIGTQGRGFKEYDVHAGGHYSLTWNQAQGMWDFRSAPAPRGA